MAGMISTAIARYHEIRILAAAQKSQASTLSVTKRRCSVGFFLYQKKSSKMAGATRRAAMRVEPMSDEKRRVTILDKCLLN